MGAATITALAKAIAARYQQSPQQEADLTVTPMELLTSNYPGTIEPDDLDWLVSALQEHQITPELREDSMELVFHLKKVQQ